MLKDKIKLVQLLRTKRENTIENYFEEAARKKMPRLAAQFNIVVDPLCFRGNPGVPTLIDITSIPSPLKYIPIAFPLFGSYDEAGGYALYQEKTGYIAAPTFALPATPVDNWYIARIDKYTGEELFPSLGYDLSSFFKPGDYYVAVLGAVPPYGAFDLYYVLLRIRTQEVAYASLLNAINSDFFYFNNMQVSYTSATQNQANIPLEIIKQSIFGKTGSDSTTLGAFKPPTEFQTELIDVPINTLMTKYILWYYGFDLSTTHMEFNFYVNYLRKTQKLDYNGNN